MTWSKRYGEDDLMQPIRKAASSPYSSPYVYCYFESMESLSTARVATVPPDIRFFFLLFLLVFFCSSQGIPTRVSFSPTRLVTPRFAVLRHGFFPNPDKGGQLTLGRRAACPHARIDFPGRRVPAYDYQRKSVGEG